MRLKNISKQNLTIPFKHKNGRGVIVTINPGQVVYCEPHTAENKQVVIYLRKQKVEISNDEKPQNGEYYHPYGLLPHVEVMKLKHQEELNPKVIDVVEEEEEIQIDLKSEEIDIEEIKVDIESENDDEIISISSENKEDISKNKGGRPKGSLNKSKSGRPKKKKPRGRPSSKKKNIKKESSDLNNLDNVTDK